MNYLHLNSLSVLLIFAGLLAECCSFVFYKRARSRFKKLKGTGRVGDIMVARNWLLFFRAAMLGVPVLLYLLRVSILPY